MKLTLATFALVFLRAIQQQNVIHGHYVLASITPFAIAASEVAFVLWVVDIGWPSVPWVGLGGALGVTSAMFIHRRVFQRGKL
jgi:hypothetical protein